MVHTIHLHAAAPPKPPVGAPCNGCGVCCAVAPCPLGMLASGRTTGACAALVWQADAGRYLCGLIAEPSARLPRALKWLAPALAGTARRSIAAGAGCDCSLETAPLPPPD